MSQRILLPIWFAVFLLFTLPQHSLAMPQSKKADAALLEATYQGDMTALKAALLRGANPNTRDEDGQTALMVASMYRHFQIVRRLLSKHAALNLKDREGNTALLLAVDSPIYITHAGPLGPSLPLVKWLLDKGAAVNIKNKKGRTALMIALEDGHFQIATLLKQAGARSDHDADYALIGAARKNDTTRALSLLTQGANVNARGRARETALILAAGEGNAMIVQALLKRGARVDTANTTGRTALMEAVEHHHADIATTLLGHRANANVQDEEGNTALHLVATCEHQGSHLGVARTLLAHGALVNMKNLGGETPLLLASEERYRGLRHSMEPEPDDTRLVKLLLDKRADVKAKSQSGDTALKQAVAAKRTDTAALLKQAGATE